MHVRVSVAPDHCRQLLLSSPHAAFRAQGLAVLLDPASLPLDSRGEESPARLGCCRLSSVTDRCPCPSLLLPQPWPAMPTRSAWSPSPSLAPTSWPPPSDRPSTRSWSTRSSACTAPPPPCRPSRPPSTSPRRCSAMRGTTCTPPRCWQRRCRCTPPSAASTEPSPSSGPSSSEESTASRRGGQRGTRSGR